ncbi:hypothetical protein GGQ64_005500 [Rhizobium azooxidifex]|uniref:Uncharacterized protein n=1 Tax=Mycoplana azooxidifex TaxID=1636188 RepID=A0A7W6DGL7_9HYPH|nr:hypothetical protein [Mycoplana azooxidifex]MBB3980247.1 hypothetical protein [Mycoplana azooxidifex]
MAAQPSHVGKDRHAVVFRDISDLCHLGIELGKHLRKDVSKSRVIGVVAQFERVLLAIKQLPLRWLVATMSAKLAERVQR